LNGIAEIMNRNFAHAALWLLGLLPAVVAWMALPPGSFSGAAASLNSAGRLTGIGGLGLFLLAAMASVRIPGFDRHFGGLTKLWQTHHSMGAVAFLLLLCHPLLLALASAGISPAAAVAVLFPPAAGTAVWLGWGALLSMMVFLAPSFAFFGPPKYQRWKKIHRLAAISAVLALAHTLWLERTIPEPWSSLIWLGLAAATIGALVYGLVFGRRASQYPYTVAEVARPANNVVELSLNPLGKPLRYEAGQFVYLSHYDGKLPGGYGEEHPYTLSSSPAELQVRIAIKDLGDASRAIQEIHRGSKVRLVGPYGAFFPPTNSDAELWIAGGIGITPFLGRARDLASRAERVDINMIYCVQDEARALFADELRQLKARIPGFCLTVHYFYRDGPLATDFVRYHCPDCSGRQVYVCGPGPLLKLAREVVLGAGVRRSNFHSEEFNLL